MQNINKHEDYDMKTSNRYIKKHSIMFWGCRNAEGDRFVTETIAAATTREGLLGWQDRRRAARCLGFSDRDARKYASIAPENNAHVRAWWVRDNIVWATGTLGDGRAYPLAGRGGVVPSEF